MSTVKGTTSDSKDGKTVHTSHLPVPETRQMKAKERLAGTKNKEKISHNESGKTKQKTKAAVSEEQPKGGRGRLGSKDKDKPQPLYKQGTKKDLIEENVRLKNETHLQTEKIKEMEDALNIEKDNVERIKSEAENKENVQQGNLEVITQKYNLAEHKLLEYQTRVLQSNIDPVTLSQIDVSSDSKDNIYLKQTKAKEEVIRLNDTLNCITSTAHEQLDYLQKMAAELDSIMDTGENS